MTPSLKSIKTFATGAIVLLSLTVSQFTHAQAFRNSAEYNLQMEVGLKGYDPVSYYSEGGSQPQV